MDQKLKMDGLRKEMQQQENEFQEREAKMLGSGADDISKLRGELEAANAHLSDVQQACTYDIMPDDSWAFQDPLKPVQLERPRKMPRPTPDIYERERLRVAHHTAVVRLHAIFCCILLINFTGT